VVEESIVDPKNKTLTTYTRNIGYTTVMTVEEKCVYRASQDNAEWTECRREAWINSNIYGFSYALQKFGVERFKNNVNKSVKGFTYALNQLFPAVSHTSSSVKLRDTAKAAKQIATSVVATNRQ
jgi:hypothetical protein